MDLVDAVAVDETAAAAPAADLTEEELMATVVSATQVAQIIAAYPKVSPSDAAKAVLSSLTTQTITTMAPVTTTVKHRKFILPNGQTLTISE